VTGGRSRAAAPAPSTRVNSRGSLFATSTTLPDGVGSNGLDCSRLKLMAAAMPDSELLVVSMSDAMERAAAIQRMVG
jgi:hypothetical protein